MAIVAGRLPQALPNSRPLLRNANAITYIQTSKSDTQTRTARLMPFLIFILMISWPVLEIASILQMNRWVGPLPTILLLLGGFAFGVFLIRSQSRLVALRVVQAIRSGDPPHKALIDTGTAALAGLLFMVPGFISDAVAVLLLIPQFRDSIWRGLSYGFRRTQPVPRQGRSEPEAPRGQDKPYRADDVIDVEYTEVPGNQGSGASKAKRAGSPWGRAQ